MEIRQLRYFVAVAEEKNFGHAARRLNVSQPPITRQMHKLEDELGVLLLKRTSKGTELTEAGKVFLEDARSILAQMERGAERTKAAQKGELGVIEIGYFGSVSYSIVPHILQLFKQDNPLVDLSLRRMSKKEQVHALKQGQLHLGFGRYYPNEPGLVIEEVINEGVALCVPTSAGIAVDESNWRDVFDMLPLILFPSAGRPNFADATVAMLKREGVSPTISMVVEDGRAALMQVAIGAGVCVVPISMIGMNWYGVDFFQPDALTDDCPVSIIYRKSDTSALLRRFLGVLRSIRQQPDRFAIDR
ncbi:LysR family transcriptional regulator [Alterisphingorhabdus coralli]|uniref:LysR family transcriptional regulator n=1 Tax=Alterisphingorhabdus coralli TaxID=3071408 RepID=A0AA97F8Q8_9SPHN|nr:LysR family transcriptional regulator [Parasphingorhabdus sp. SCSIO 66989]WOE75352.1 LysR family transcriptional regulator [Parasphingorhabdus sp. SCSIO 66989]